MIDKYCRCLLQALASVGEWEALRKFGSERKSPIGYKPFALACMRTKHTGLFGQDAERYITSYIDRVRETHINDQMCTRLFITKLYVVCCTGWVR